MKQKVINIITRVGVIVMLFFLYIILYSGITIVMDDLKIIYPLLCALCGWILHSTYVEEESSGELTTK